VGEKSLLTKAVITIDCDNYLGNLNRIWASIGYDEINWTYTRRGKNLFRILKEIAETPYYIRNHNALTSSNGLSRPAWGGGNVYHEEPDGSPIYNWDILDQVYDTILEAGFYPFVEFGFLPFDLVPDGINTSDWNQDVGFEHYETEGYWKYPPKDYNRWGELVFKFIDHYVKRYGKETIKNWLFELWNEPDLGNYWKGSVEDYLRLFDVTVHYATKAFSEIKIGGPCTTSPSLQDGSDFLKRFLQHCVSEINYITGKIGTRLDFISFHTKGAHYSQRRIYNLEKNIIKESPSKEKMIKDIKAGMDIISKFPSLSDLPVYVNECDPAVGTIYGVHDNPNFIVTNTEYYPAFIVALVKEILDLQRNYSNPIERITSWAFYFEGKRFFEGNRTLITNDEIEKPIINIFRMLSLLGNSRIKLISHVDLQDVHISASSFKIDGIATMEDRTISIIIWNQADEWWQEGECHIELNIDHIPFNNTAILKHFRIDKQYSNAYSAWKAEGSPINPSIKQIKKIKLHQGLELIQKPEEIQIDNSKNVNLSFSIPLPGISLIQIISKGQ